MRLLPLLLSLIYPACGTEGAVGLPVPSLMDMAHISRPATPNTALAAPAGFAPQPDIVTHFAAPPDALYTALRRFTAGEPRLYIQVEFADRRQIHFVARTPAANFPDLIAAQVTPQGGLILWSRSVYGRSDFGVNRARLAAWVAGIESQLAADMTAAGTTAAGTTAAGTTTERR